MEKKNELKLNEKDYKNIYRLVCDIYNVNPSYNYFYQMHFEKKLPVIKEMFNEVELSDEDKVQLRNYFNNDGQLTQKLLKKFRTLKSLKGLKEPKNTFTSINKKGINLYVDGLGTNITKEECESYIQEIYDVFSDLELPRITLNSTKEEIKYFLNKMVDYVWENDINHNKYNYHHLGFIHTYFLDNGNYTVAKSMEKFLSNYYRYEDITDWYVDFNIKRNNKDSKLYRVKVMNMMNLQYDDIFKKEEHQREDMANKVARYGDPESLLAFAQFYYSRNTYKSNYRARKALIKLLNNSNDSTLKLKAYDLLLSHLVKLNYNFKSKFDLNKLADALYELKDSSHYIYTMFLLAYNFYDGYGVKQNIDKAKKLFTQFTDYTLEDIKDDNVFNDILENFLQKDYRRLINKLYK